MKVSKNPYIKKQTKEYYFYCPNCKSERIVNKLPKHTVGNSRDGFGLPIYHYKCDKCNNLDAGFMRIIDNVDIEDAKRYYRNVISQYQNIRGIEKS